MDVVDNAVDGAPVAPAEIEQAVESQEPTTEKVEAPEPARNEKGQFVPQERVNEITRARRDAERRVLQLEQELAQRPLAKPQSTGAVPSMGEYEYDEKKWAAAMAEYTDSVVDQKLNARDQQRTQQQAAQGFEAKSREYEAVSPGYMERLSSLDATVSFSSNVLEVIATSDHGPALADYLAQHLDVADRISRLPDHIAALQLGRLEAQVSAPKLKPVTNAPNPTPTLGGGSPNPAKDPARQTDAEWYSANKGR